MRARPYFEEGTEEGGGFNNCGDSRWLPKEKKKEKEKKRDHSTDRWW